MDIITSRVVEGRGCLEKQARTHQLVGLLIDGDPLDFGHGFEYGFKTTARLVERRSHSSRKFSLSDSMMGLSVPDEAATLTQHVCCSLDTPESGIQPARACMLASAIFLHDLLLHLLVQSQACRRAFQNAWQLR